MVPQNGKILCWSKIGAGLIFVYAAITGYQAHLTRIQFIKDQRPYVWLSNELGKPGRLPNGQIYWGLWYYQNYGKAPADNLVFNQGINLGTDALKKPRTFTGPDQPAPPLPPTKVDDSTSVSTDKISQEEYDQLLHSDKTIVVYGRFKYTDASGHPYESGFCFMHIVANTNPMYCPEPGSNYIH